MSKKKDQDRQTVYFRYNEKHRIIRNDFDSDDWSGYNEGKIEFSPVSLRLTKPLENDYMQYFESLVTDVNVKDGDKVWLVVVRYTDGGTFGCTHGHHYVVGLYKNEDEAYSVKEKIHQDKWEIRYKPWTGYFASLDDVEVHRMEIDP